MKLSRLPGIVLSVPIKHAISRIAVLLDLDQHISAPNSMKTSRRQKHRVARLNFETVDKVRHFSRSHRLRELTPGDSFPKADVQFCARNGRDYVPKFSFRFAAKPSCDLFGRMHLYRK